MHQDEANKQTENTDHCCCEHCGLAFHIPLNTFQVQENLASHCCYSEEKPCDMVFGYMIMFLILIFHHRQVPVNVAGNRISAAVT